VCSADATVDYLIIMIVRRREIGGTGMDDDEWDLVVVNLTCVSKGRKRGKKGENVERMGGMSTHKSVERLEARKFSG
jgi:hypothetical protein